eukprot:TRINITY_DN32754_c0_g1_i1.p1 TRINITY_DN32754_c0_g1~~TRINITY_DN32754_c0_g1_i1.p1  ORF type:complete len:753 (+),score=159.49 TRINITY_DN32754_c0_g1_i1:191-2449(+)
MAAPMASKLTRHVNERVHRERTAEARLNDIKQSINQDRVAGVRAQSDFRVEGKRVQRANAAERQELFSDYQYMQAEEQREKKRCEAELQERVAAELVRKKTEEIRDEANRRRIVEGSEEIRALKEKLHAAAVSQVRAVQLLDRQAREEEDQQHRAQLDAHLESQRVHQIELDSQAEREKAQECARVVSQGKDQARERHQRLEQDALERQAREREQVEAIKARIIEEDEREMRERRHRQQDSRDALNHQRLSHEKQLRAQSQAEAEADAKDLEYVQRKRALADQIAREEFEKRREMERVATTIGREQDRKQQEERELCLLREELHLEELDERHRRREAEQAQKKHEDMMQLQRDQKNEMRQRQEKAKRREEEEQIFRERLMVKFAQDDRIDQMNAQKRRMRLLEHRREVDRQVQERRELNEAERKRQLEEEQREKETDALRQRIIEEERQRLLEEQAVPLRNFLPKDVLKTESDYRLVSGDCGAIGSCDSVASNASGGRDQHHVLSATKDKPSFDCSSIADSDDVSTNIALPTRQRPAPPTAAWMAGGSEGRGNSRPSSVGTRERRSSFGVASGRGGCEASAGGTSDNTYAQSVTSSEGRRPASAVRDGGTVGDGISAATAAAGGSRRRPSSAAPVARPASDVAIALGHGGGTSERGGRRPASATGGAVRGAGFRFGASGGADNGPGGGVGVNSAVAAVAVGTGRRSSSVPADGRLQPQAHKLHPAGGRNGPSGGRAAFQPCPRQGPPRMPAR